MATLGARQYFRDDSSFVFLTSDDVLNALLINSNAPYIRRRLLANTIFYAATTGSDSNNGLTIGTPWQHVNYALAFISQNYDFNGYSAALQLADGTYAENVSLPAVVGKGSLGQATAIIQGNAANHSAVIIAPATGNCSVAVDINGGGWTWKNVRFTTPAGAGIFVDYNAATFIDGCVFDVCTNHIQAANGGFSEAINNPYDVVGGAAGAHFNMVNQGKFIAQASAHCQIPNALAFGFFAFANTQGNIDAEFLSITGAGVAGTTGTRYSSSGVSIINVGGASPTFFPGNVGGSTANGGQYT